MKVLVIGSGFAGLSAATYLASFGYQVTLVEKNDSFGGRARQMTIGDYVFDMGPSWYWMPDVFDAYFADFGKSSADYYELIRLDPSYSVVFGPDDVMNIPADYAALLQLFEELEPGSSERLQKFLSQAEYKYKVGIQDLVHKPGLSLTEFLSPRLALDMLRLDVFQSFHNHVRKYLSHPHLIQLIEFPILFLGAIAKNTPALYSLMNYADIKLGTWYPLGGMYKVVEGMVQLARDQGVNLITNCEIESFTFDKGNIKAAHGSNQTFDVDVVVAGADYHHVETRLLPQSLRSYTDQYWQKRTLAPSSLLFYLGFDCKIPTLEHHTLFFDADFHIHSEEIYQRPSWPSSPLFYVNMPSKTDPEVGPPDGETMVILIPVAPDLKDDDATREKYFEIVMRRIEKITGHDLQKHIVVKKSYAHRDFISDYHAFKGNAYGLANILRQTAILKPSLKSKKVKNLYYTGQLTVPGPGVPPSLISGKVVSKVIEKHFHRV